MKRQKKRFIRIARMTPIKPYTLVGVLILGIAWIVMTRVHLYNQPTGVDQAIYAYIGHELLSGKRLYTDVWDQKPPFIYLTYAAAEIAVGYGQRQLFVLGLIATLLTFWGVYQAGRWGTGSVRAGLWAGLFYALSSSDIYLEAQLPNAESFQNACAIWGMAFYFRWFQKRRSGDLLAFSLCFVAATLFKQIMIVIPACLFIVDLYQARRNVIQRQFVFQGLVISAAIGCAIWGGMGLYFIAQHRGPDLYYALIQFNQDYARFNPQGQGGLLLNMVRGTWPPSIAQSIPPSWLLGLVPALIVCGLAYVPFRRKECPPWPWGLALAYAIGSHFAIALPGRLYSHYYQLALPPLSLLAGWLVEAGYQQRGRIRGWAIGVGLAGLACLFVYEVPLFLKSPEECSDVLVHGWFVADRQLGKRIKDWTLPGETIYQWGHEAPIYFYSERRAASGFLSMSHVFIGRQAPRFRDRLLKDLKAEQPELFVVTQEGGPALRFDPELKTWLQSAYTPFPYQDSTGFYELYMRTGGALEKRVRNSAGGRKAVGRTGRYIDGMIFKTGV